MTFEDLPRDWATRPINSDLTEDVLDLLVTAHDREAGAIYVLICDDDGRLVQPVVVGLEHADQRSAANAQEAERLFDGIAHLVQEAGRGGILVAIARTGFSAIGDADRRWHQAAINATRARAVPLLGTYIVTHHDVVQLPEPTQLPARRTA